MKNIADNKKKIIIIIIVTASILLLMAILGWTYARYSSKIKGNIAATISVPIVIFSPSETLTLPITDLEPGETKEYLFDVVNFKNGVKTDVIMLYKILLKTESNLPLTFELYKNNKPINILNENLETLTQVLTREEKQTDNYKLVIKWDIADNDVRYAGEIDYLRIEINGKQAIGTEIENIQVSGLNRITKQGLSTPTTDSSYWSLLNQGFTPLSNGWGRYQKDNSGGSGISYINSFISGAAIELKPNTKYTIMTEIRKYDVEGTANLWLSQGWQPNDPFIEERSLSGVGVYKSLLTTDDDVEGKVGLRIFVSVGIGSTATIEARVMLMEGDHTNKDIIYERYISID